MKKNLLFMFLFIAFMSLVPIKAHAWGSAKDERIQPPAKTEIVAEAVPSPTIGEVKSTVNRLLVSSREKIETTIGKKDSETAKAITIAGDANATAIKDAMKSINDDAKARETTLAGELVKSKKDSNEIISGNTSAMTAVKDAIGNNALFLGIGILFAIVIIVVVIRKNTTAIISAVTTVGNRVDIVGVRVSAIPNDTAALINELESFTEKFTIADHEVTIKAVPVNGSYPTLYVPKSFSTEIANPAEITTKKAHARGEFCADTISLMKKYLSGSFDGSDGYSRNQKKVIEHAQWATKILVITKIV